MAWKRVKGGDILLSLCYCFADPWPNLFLALVCVCVRVCVGCGSSFMRDPTADVTFLPVKATTSASHKLMCVTHQSYRKCVFPFTSHPLFPIKSTKENVIHSSAARLKFSLHVQVNQHHRDSRRKGMPFEPRPFIEKYLREPIKPTCWSFK